jgi:hypothetical protein
MLVRGNCSRIRDTHTRRRFSPPYRCPIPRRGASASFCRGMCRAASSRLQVAASAPAVCMRGRAVAKRIRHCLPRAGTQRRVTSGAKSSLLPRSCRKQRGMPMRALNDYRAPLPPPGDRGDGGSSSAPGLALTSPPNRRNESNQGPKEPKKCANPRGGYSRWRPRRCCSR